MRGRWWWCESESERDVAVDGGGAWSSRRREVEVEVDGEEALAAGSMRGRAADVAAETDEGEAHRLPGTTFDRGRRGAARAAALRRAGSMDARRSERSGWGVGAVEMQQPVGKMCALRWLRQKE